MMRQAPAAKLYGVSPSIIDSLRQHSQMVDSLKSPEISRLLAGMTLNIPTPTIADSIRSQLQVFDAGYRQLARAIDSSAVVQAIQAITSSAWAEQFARMSAQFQAAINRLSFSINHVLSEALLPIRELAERIGEASRVRSAFIHYSLWLAPSMSEELVGKIVRLYEAGASSGTVHSVVSGYYAKDDWRRLEEIFEDAGRTRCSRNV